MLPSLMFERGPEMQRTITDRFIERCHRDDDYARHGMLPTWTI